MPSLEMTNEDYFKTKYTEPETYNRKLIIDK